MDKKVWKQPEMQIQAFAANEYVAACNEPWTEKGCVGNTNDGDYVKFTHNKKYMEAAADQGFTYGEFLDVDSWSEHHCAEGTVNDPNRKVLYMLNSWWNTVDQLIKDAKANNNYNKDTVIDEQYWGFGFHPGNSGHHIYDEVFHENHSS